MSDAQIICKLLRFAFLEIRIHAKDDSRTVFAIAHTFHNIPSLLGSAINGVITYEEVLARLLAESEQTGCSAWIQSHIQNLRNE